LSDLKRKRLDISKRHRDHLCADPQGNSHGVKLVPSVR
jgi:hypothetical protein